jgi:hypothetical protein
MQTKHRFVYVFIVSLLALGGFGCKELNREAYCPTHPDDLDCGPKPEKCGDVMCAAPRPVCDITTTTCVQCTNDSHCLVGVCSDQHACIECETDEDCPSKLCLVDQTCALPEEVTYIGGVNPMDNPTCLIDAPCKSLAQAFTATALRKYIKLIGPVTNADVFTISDKKVIIYGRSGAQISRTTGMGEVLIIKGMMNPEITMYDLEIVCNAGAGGKDCVEIIDKATVTMVRVNLHSHGFAGIAMAGTKLVLDESEVHGNTLEGLEITGGTVELRHSLIYENKGAAGIHATNATLVTIDSSTIAANSGTAGGVSITGPFSIRNSIIAGNGNITTTTSAGGLTLNPLNAANAKFEFNTVADNVSAAATKGLACVTTPFDVSNSIFVNLVPGTTAISGCNVTYSLTDITGTPSPGMGNKVGDPLFLSTGLGNSQFYHISGTSPARDSADPVSTFDIDIDGDPRNDARRDMGADEVKPQ